MGDVADVDGVIDPREDVSQTQLFFMTFYWLAHLAQWAGVLFVLAPAQVSLMVGESQKATYLSLLVMCGGIVSLFASPLIGTLSDRLITSRYACRSAGHCVCDGRPVRASPAHVR